MFGLSWFKLGSAIAALVAFGALIYFAQDRFDQKEKADAAADCNAVAFRLAGDLDDCLPEVRSAIEERRQAEACDTALTAERRLPARSRFAVRHACSAAVKTVYAERDAARRNADDAQRALDNIQAKTDAAVRRAEKRGANIQKRKTDATRAIEAAPVGADGLLECDADCLRGLGG